MNKTRWEEPLPKLKAYLSGPLWRLNKCAVNFDVDVQKYRRSILTLPGHPKPIPATNKDGTENKSGALEFIAEEMRRFHQRLGVKPLQQMTEAEFEAAKAGELLSREIDESAEVA